MDGLDYSQDKITMEKPYLSVLGLDCFGHAKFHRATDPLSTHFHENCVEIVFVLKGQQIYHIGETAYTVDGGEAFFSFLEQPHSSDGDGQGVGEFYWMQLNLSRPESFLGLNRELSLDLTEKLRAIDRHVFRFQPPKEIKLLLEEAFTEFLEFGTTPLAISYLSLLLQLMLSNMQENRLEKNRFSELEKYIDAHLGETLRIEDLSAACHLSPSTLQHKFKDYFGRTPAEYVNYRKIQRAKELLLDGKTITETAMLLDFNTSDYFSTVFRKFNGISPSSWLFKKRNP